MHETQETQVRSLGQEDPLEKGWQSTPVFLPRESQGRGTEEPGGLHSIPPTCEWADMLVLLRTGCEGNLNMELGLLGFMASFPFPVFH